MTIYKIPNLCAELPEALQRVIYWDGLPAFKKAVKTFQQDPSIRLDIKTQTLEQLLLVVCGMELAEGTKAGPKNLPLLYARFLLENGVDPNGREGIKTAQSPLLMAVENRNLEMIHLLHKHKADIDIQSIYGGTALSYALARGEVAMSPVIDLLLEKGANPNAGNSPAWFFALGREFGNSTVIHKLFDQGADINIVSAAGESALHHFSRLLIPWFEGDPSKEECEFIDAVFDFLETNGLDIDAKNAKGQTAKEALHADGSDESRLVLDYLLPWEALAQSKKIDENTRNPVKSVTHSRRI